MVDYYIVPTPCSYGISVGGQRAVDLYVAKATTDISYYHVVAGNFKPVAGKSDAVPRRGLSGDCEIIGVGTDLGQQLYCPRDAKDDCFARHCG